MNDQPTAEIIGTVTTNGIKFSVFSEFDIRPLPEIPTKPKEQGEKIPGYVPTVGPNGAYLGLHRGECY